jgi:endonuclease/exonuclease/phosphatase family metal-dependent hydrolase
MLPRRRRRVRRLEILRQLVSSRMGQKRKVYYPCYGTDILFASYNIHKCVGLDGRFNPGRTMSVIREIDADVIALQEVDQRFGERAGLLDIKTLERECGLVPVPLTGTRRSHGWRGNLVLFREGTVTAAHQLALPGVEPRGALIVDLELTDGPLRIIAAHFGLLRRSRALQVRAILSAAGTLDGRPSVLMGDLNEWRLGKRSSLRALEPTFGPPHAAVASFPSRFPVLSLDRILANPHTIMSHIEVHDTPLARMASDHLPVKASINLGADRRRARSLAELAAAA